MKSNLVMKKFARGLSTKTAQLAAQHQEFLQNIAKIEAPQKLPVLLDLLELQGQTLVAPNERAGLNPLLVPIARDADQQLLCYLRWPTQKENMDIQLVKTTETGVRLVSLSTDKFIRRTVAELDFQGDALAKEAASLVNKEENVYTLGDSVSFMKNGKFPCTTAHEQRLVLDRFLILKVGAFPECYERLADNFFNTKNDLSALVTCERLISCFFGWGHPVNFHAKLLSRMGREREAHDAARSSMQSPKWTLASSKADLENILSLAGFSNSKIVGDMHKFRSTDPRQKEVDEGLTKEQVALDQAAHLMDAVTLGSVEGGWDAARKDIAERYRLGGYPDIAAFVEAVN